MFSSKKRVFFLLLLLFFAIISKLDQTWHKQTPLLYTYINSVGIKVKGRIS